MKNKLKRFILLLGIICLGTAIGGCSIGMDSLDDIIEKNNLTAKITYYSNGGWFNNDSSSVSRDIYYKENSKAFEITSETQTKIKHGEYLYDGWYTIKTATVNGESYFVCDVSPDEALEYKIGERVAVVESGDDLIIKISDYKTLAESANVPLLSLDEPFDFKAQTLKKGDELYLATRWVPNQKVEYVLFAENCQSIDFVNSDNTTTTYNHGEVILTKTFDNKGVFEIPTRYNLAPKAEDATFIDYYVYDESASVNNLVRLADSTDKLYRPEDGSNIKIYAKFTHGDWKVMRFGEDIKNLFIYPSANHYLSRDIDCSEETNTYFIDAFSGKLQGNGYTINGVKIAVDRLNSGSKASLFGRLGNSTVIKDVTFKNVSLTCSSRPNSFISVSLFATAINDGETPTLSNVNINGVTVKVTLANDSNSNIENIPYVDGEGYDTSSWLLGGYTNEQFLTNFSTVQLTNYQLIINDTTIATDIPQA